MVRVAASVSPAPRLELENPPEFPASVARLASLLDAWSNVVHAKPADTGEHEAWLTLLSVELAKVKRELEAYYEADASADLYVCVPELFPEHRALVERLRREHQGILAELAALAEALWAGRAPGTGPGLLKRARCVVERISHNERCELDMLEEAFWAAPLLGC